MKNLSLRETYFFVILSIIFIILIIFIVIKIISFKNNEGKNIPITNITNNSWKIKYKELEKDTDAEVLLVKKWEDKEIYEKYNEVKYNDIILSSNKSIIEEENIDIFLTKVVLNGYDDTNTENKINANIYKIKGVSYNCAIAIKFENDMQYYVYINFKYKPNTLSDLVEDLNLKNTIYFDTIIYNNIDGQENIEFENINDNDVWNLLFYNLSLNNEYSNINNDSKCIMTIIARIPLLGYKKVNINIMSDGYIHTNILNTEEAFFIGEEKMQEFIEYISKNYEGFKVIYRNINDNTEIIKNTLN
ncbi:MAG: hypothetical protein HFJ45_02115 [Clostridia bacterium]|nr:hypothetical protein [Clostridia bacterium]